MFCLTCLTLITYFIILGIFLPSKRKFIKEAIKCFWHKLIRKHCTDAFDDLMQNRFVMWLSNKGWDKGAKFFVDKTNFAVFVNLIGVAFFLVNILLLILLYNFLFVKSPCIEGGVCRL